MRRFQLPRLTGYLLFGVIVGPYVSNLITAPMAAQLQVFTGIATTLIALIAGLTLSVERLGSRIGAIVKMTRDDAGGGHGRPGGHRLAGVALAAGGAAMPQASNCWPCWPC